MKREGEVYQPVSIGTIELSTIDEEFIAEMSPGEVYLTKRIEYYSIEV